MSAATDTQTPTGVPTIAIDEIDVAEGHNPRQRFDEQELAELESSIAEHGVVQAITVRPGDEEGRFTLVSGERRLIAAKRAGLTAIPALVREGEGALGAAVAENLIRADLDVIEEAEALKRLAELEDLDQAGVAKRVGRSRSWVSERLRLLKLPEGCREGFASGELPLAAEAPLRSVAKVSAGIAEALAARALADRQGDLLVSDLASALYGLAGAIEDLPDPERPTLIGLNHRGLSGDLIADETERAELLERWRATLKRLGYGSGFGDEDELWVSITEDHIDAARAAGVLLEVATDSEWQSDHRFLVDEQFGADLLRRGVEDAERRATERQVEAAKRAEERGEEAPADPMDEDAAKAERRRERERREKDRARAAKHNDKLGVALVRRRGAQSRKKHSLARAKALAKVVLGAEPNLAARGLRYALPQLREVEVKTLKSGETREKLVLAEAAECAAYLERKVEEAKSPQEVLEVMADAMIAASYADQREVAGSHRVQFWNRAVADAVSGELGADVKDVKIKRAPGS